MRAGSGICGKHEQRSEHGRGNTTKSGRTAVWGTGRRRPLRPVWRVVEKTLRLRIPQKTRDSHFPTTPATTTSCPRRVSRGQTSYDPVRGARGHISSAYKLPQESYEYVSAQQLAALVALPDEV